MLKQNPADVLPGDGTKGTLVGRAWVPAVQGPSLVRVDADGVHDISRAAATMAELCNAADPVALARSTKGERLGSLADLLAGDLARPHLIAPVDLQAVKAAGVTFVASMLERLVEEMVKGDPGKGDAARRTIQAEIGTSLATLRPGSPEAERLKQALI